MNFTSYQMVKIPCTRCGGLVNVMIQVHYRDRPRPDTDIIRPRHEAVLDLMRAMAQSPQRLPHRAWEIVPHRHSLVFWFGGPIAAFRAAGVSTDYTDTPLSWHAMAAPFLPAFPDEDIADVVSAAPDEVASLRQLIVNSPKADSALRAALTQT